MSLPGSHKERTSTDVQVHILILKAGTEVLIFLGRGTTQSPEFSGSRQGKTFGLVLLLTDVLGDQRRSNGLAQPDPSCPPLCADCPVAWCLLTLARTVVAVIIKHHYFT